jgi:Chalcone isomerase-like
MAAVRTLWRSVLRGLGLAGMLWVACQAMAADPPSDAAQPPPEIATVLPAATLQGRATMRFIGLAIYEVRLWAAAGFTPERYDTQPFALELRYARRFEGAVIAERSIAEMRRTAPVDDMQARAWQSTMTLAFPDVVAGDRLTGVYPADGTARFFHNARPTASVSDAEFARRFFGMWLTPTTSEPALRRRLIGQAP